jgi:succinoglycan biosynthesis transport protein ExoP
MLQLNKDHTPVDGRPDAFEANEPSMAETFTYALGVVRRQIFAVLLFAMLGTGLSLLIFLKAEPPYTATATLLVDTHKIDILQQSAVSTEMSIGAIGAMESQIELLKSDQVALSVIKKLRLWEAEIRWRRKPGIVSRLAYQYFPRLSPERSLKRADRLKQALKLFKRA